MRIFLNCLPSCSLRLDSELKSELSSMASQLASGIAYLCFLSAGITGSGIPCPLSISVDSGCENSGPHFFLASILTTEPSSQPYVNIVLPPSKLLRELYERLHWDHIACSVNICSFLPFKKKRTCHIKNKFLYYCMCMRVTHAYATGYMWRSEDNVGELVLSRD